MPKGVPKEGNRKSPKERAPNWPADPRVMEVLVAKTVEVLKMPEVGGNPWQSRKLSETFRIVHEQLMASRDKARPALCVRAPANPLCVPVLCTPPRLCAPLTLPPRRSCSSSRWARTPFRSQQARCYDR
jgi:hypothetical protein